MKKTVIANYGIASKGKSDTLKRIAQTLLRQFPNAITDPVNIDYSVDIKVIIQIDDIKIGIESQGDPNSRIFKSLEYFVEVQCDIIICATRTEGATVDAVCELNENHGYDVIWVTNYRSDEKNHQLLNQMSANQIVELIRSISSNQL